MYKKFTLQDKKSIFRRECSRSNSPIDIDSNKWSFNEIRNELNVTDEKETK